jgi:hypothetical protein
MLEPYKGRVFDPCCGSGGMFVQSEKFVAEHQGKINDISIYGQESNQTTWRLAKMNLAIRGIDSSQVKWNNEGSFLNDAHKDLKADYIISNPPFNDKDWGGEILRNDGRWKYGIPPVSNANYGWIQHFIFHLSPVGRAGFLLADSSTSIPSGAELEIRKNIVNENLVDCIVVLPSHLFSNTPIAVCIWFLDRNRGEKDDVLFIDASKLGLMIERNQRVLSDQDVLRISDTYKGWRASLHEDARGFSRAVSLEEIRTNHYNLSPNRYISPVEQDIQINLDIDSPKYSENISRLRFSLNSHLEEIILGCEGSAINISDAWQLVRLSQETEVISRRLYEPLMHKYFIEQNNERASGNICDGWVSRRFDQLFSESGIKVRDIEGVPPVYSVTNAGIQPREGKFSKELSKSPDNYKVAYRGDMVFGLSREIPNLDVFVDEIGAFSPAYHIFRPHDVRIGLIVGTLMRMKLMEQTDILKGGAREGRGLDKSKLFSKAFILPEDGDLDAIWKPLKNFEAA